MQKSLYNGNSYLITQKALMDSNNKTILDLIKFDITTFYIGEYKEINTQDTPAIQVVDYEKKLPELEFNLFDTLRFRVMFDKSNITGATHINASLRSKKKRATMDETKTIVCMLHDIMGIDDNKNKGWSDNDAIAFSNYSLNRIWPTGKGDNFVSIHYNEISGLELNILFLNNLLNNLGKKLLF